MIDPDKQYDPLLECVVIFARLHSRPIGVEALIAGLPVEPGADGPELFSIDSPKGLFSRVAARAGFASRLIRRDIDKLSRLLLPCILVLKNGNACILHKPPDQQEFTIFLAVGRGIHRHKTAVAQLQSKITAGTGISGNRLQPGIAVLSKNLQCPGQQIFR